MAKLYPCLWYSARAEEAARFYASVLPDSRVHRVDVVPGETPSGPEGAVKVVDFTLVGQRIEAFEAGPLDPFNHAISLVLECDDQAEVDRFWDALGEGGTTEQCGWLRDRYGVAWQIVPRRLNDMMRDPDRARGRRVTEAMLGMVKLEVAALERAYAGEGG